MDGAPWPDCLLLFSRFHALSEIVTQYRIILRMPRESGHFKGSDCLPWGPDRHGFPKNRHGYFSNPSVCPRIGGLEPAACHKKALFSAVLTDDHGHDRPIVPEMERGGILGILRSKSHNASHPGLPDPGAWFSTVGYSATMGLPKEAGLSLLGKERFIVPCPIV
jgi:hypothetical protein